MRTRIAILLSILVMTLMAAGCERDIESKDPVRSVNGEVPIPINLRAELGQQTITLYWAVTDTSAVSRFRIYWTTLEAGEFLRHDSTTGFSKTLTDLRPNQTYYFQVSSVSREGVEGDASEIIAATATVLSISIADDAPCTGSRDVLVQVNVPATVSHVKLSEQPDLADAAFRLFTGTQTRFRLSDGDGTKRVYAMFLFQEGSQSADPVQDDIVLDTRAEISSVSFSPTGTVFTAGQTVTFSLDAGETGGTASVSFTGVSGVSLYDGDQDGVYTGQWVVPLNFSLSNGIVTGLFTDAAGNWAPNRDAGETITVADVPLPVTLAATPVSTWKIDLTWTRSVSGDFAAYRVFRALTPDVSNSSELVVSVPAQPTTAYTDTVLDDNTLYYYAVYVYDNNGLSSMSNVASARTLVNTAPEAVTLFAFPDPPAAGDTATGTLEWTANGDEDLESYRVFYDRQPLPTPSDSMVSYESSRQATTFRFEVFGSGAHYFRAYVYDRHGLFTESNQVTVFIP